MSSVGTWRDQPRPTLTRYSQRSAADKAAAEAAHDVNHAALRKLQRASKGCADCTAKISGWAALPHGSFICINCAQIHRRIGRHISQVKAVNTGTYLWFPDEVELMAWGGNLRVAAEYCGAAMAPPRPDETAPVHIKEKYIRAKYEKKQWYKPLPSKASHHHAPARRHAGKEEQHSTRSLRCDAASAASEDLRGCNIMDDDTSFRAWKAKQTSTTIVCGGGDDFFGSFGL